MTDKQQKEYEQNIATYIPLTKRQRFLLQWCIDLRIAGLVNKPDGVALEDIEKQRLELNAIWDILNKFKYS